MVVHGSDGGGGMMRINSVVWLVDSCPLCKMCGDAEWLTIASGVATPTTKCKEKTQILEMSIWLIFYAIENLCMNADNMYAKDVMPIFSCWFLLYVCVEFN